MTGYGYHADFIMGWEEEFLQSAIDTCTNESGRIQDCPLFDVISESEAASCEMKLPQALAKEEVKGPMKKLPGGNEITYGGGSDEGSSEGTESSVASSAPTLTYAPGDKPENSASPLPGQVFKETSVYEAPAPTTSEQTSILPEPVPSSSPSTTSIQTSSVAEVGAAEVSMGAQLVQPPAESLVETSVQTSVEPTVAEAPATTPAPELVEVTETKSYYSTQFVTNGNIVSKILWEEERVYVTEIKPETLIVTVTSTVVAPPAPLARRRRHAAHLHRHGHHHI